MLTGFPSLSSLCIWEIFEMYFAPFFPLSALYASILFTISYRGYSTLRLLNDCNLPPVESTSHLTKKGFTKFHRVFPCSLHSAAESVPYRHFTVYILILSTLHFWVTIREQFIAAVSCRPVFESRLDWRQFHTFHSFLLYLQKNSRNSTFK
jgi:hypothetical protein